MKLTTKDFNKAKRALEAVNVPKQNVFILHDDLVPSVTTPEHRQIREAYLQQYKVAGVFPEQQGITPMAYNNSPTTATTAVSINATAQKSDLQIQREYVLSRLEDMKARWNVFPEALQVKMRKLFRLDAKGRPTKPQELIDAIKGGKFTIDQKRIDKLIARAEYEDDFEDDDYDPLESFGPLSFIDFPDFPKPDRDGYQAAGAAYATDWQKIKDQIMTGDPAEAMLAVQALADWTPPAKAS